MSCFLYRSGFAIKEIIFLLNFSRGFLSKLKQDQYGYSKRTMTESNNWLTLQLFLFLQNWLALLAIRTDKRNKRHRIESNYRSKYSNILWPMYKAAAAAASPSPPWRERLRRGGVLRLPTRRADRHWRPHGALLPLPPRPWSAGRLPPRAVRLRLPIRVLLLHRSRATRHPRQPSPGRRQGCCCCWSSIRRRLMI